MAAGERFTVTLFCNSCGTVIATSLPAIEGNRGAPLAWPGGVDVRSLKIGKCCESAATAMRREYLR